jgi:hypothetical protein
MMVNPEPVTLGVTVGEEPSLKHFVWRETYSGNNTCRIEGSLFDIKIVVFRVLVQLEVPNLGERNSPLYQTFVKSKGL